MGKGGKHLRTQMSKDFSPACGKKLISCWQLLMLATLDLGHKVASLQKWVLFLSQCCL